MPRSSWTRAGAGAGLALALACSNSLPELVLAGKEDRVHALIGRGRDVDERDERGCTALFHAACRGDRGLETALLANGASPDAACEAGPLAGMTPLHCLAVRLGGHPEADVRLLLAAGATVDKAAGPRLRTPLAAASLVGNVAVARALLAGGAAVDRSDADGLTPMSIAGQRQNIRMMKLLLEYGAECPAGLCDTLHIDKAELESAVRTYAAILQMNIAPLLQGLQQHLPRSAPTDIEVAVQPTLESLPNAWVDPERPGRVFLDATYLYSNRNASALAAAAELDLGWTEEDLERQYRRYREQAAVAFVAAMRAPWFQLDDPPTDAGPIESEKFLVMRVFLAFVVLHEVAHLRLCHPRGGRLAATEQRRTEREADAWALETMNRLGYPMPVLARLFAVQAHLERIRGEVGYVPPANHPSWQEREDAVRALLAAVPPVLCDELVLRVAAAEPVEITLPQSIAAAGSSEARLSLGSQLLDATVRADGDRIVLRARSGDTRHVLSIESITGHRPRVEWSEQDVVSGALKRQRTVTLLHAHEPRMFAAEGRFPPLRRHLDVVVRRLQLPRAQAEALARLLLEEAADRDRLSADYVDGILDERTYGSRVADRGTATRRAVDAILGETRAASFWEAWFMAREAVCPAAIDETALPTHCPANPA